MLFNSFEFIFLFLPITFFVYFGLNKLKLVQISKGWLVLASLFFYSFWNIKYLPLIVVSMIFNYSIGTTLNNPDDVKLKINKKIVLIFGITGNLLLLGYYKYFDFFLNNINHLFKADLQLLHIILPLGISFFTFTQIAYLADAYKQEVKEADFMNYALFVTYFPHLIAGPILHHSEMMPQFSKLKNKIINHKNIGIGLILIAIGLFKKTIIADGFSHIVSVGFDEGRILSTIEVWIVSLSYTFQLYFDFSGYTDMALGAALLFNIALPINFNSPYKATNIQDFWKRWHITLSRFLKNYVYIPFGGNKKGEFNTFKNLFLTFLIGGLWHGAAWTYVLWGALHGMAMVVHRLWQKINIKIHSAVAWFITFNFVSICWIIFRAKTISSAATLIKAYLFGNVIIPKIHRLDLDFAARGSQSLIGWENGIINILYLAIVLAIVLIAPNSMEIIKKFKAQRSFKFFIIFSIIAFIIKMLYFSGQSEFIYFQF